MSDRFGAPRAAEPADMAGLKRLATTVFRSPDLPADTMAREYPLLFAAENLPDLRIICADGDPVSLVGTHIRPVLLYGARITAGGIGAVCTYDEHRGRGLATRLLADAERHLDERGVDIIIVSGGRGLYRRNGYEPAGQVRTYRVPAGQPVRVRLQMREATDADLPAMARLYVRKPVRFIRSLEDFRQTLAASRTQRHPGPRHTRLAFVADRCVAYLSASVVTADGQTTLKTNELAGDPPAIVALAADLAAGADAAHLALAVSGGHEELALACDRLGLPVDIAPDPGTTYKLPDAARLLEKLRPHLRERAGDEAVGALRFRARDAGLEFALGTERFHLRTGPDLLRLLFEPGLARPDLPADALGDTLAACFPLPMVWQGFNYV